MIGDPTIIELKPEWFKPGYYVYIVVMAYKRSKYYYVGMTGDRKFTTARSPFYRMSGHFVQIKSSTQNQVIKGIREKFGNKNIDKILVQSTFTYYCYLIDEFIDGQKDLHKSKRKRAEKVESWLIKQFWERFNSNVFNKKG